MAQVSGASPRSDGVQIRFRVRFQVAKVPNFGGFPVENPTKKANRLKALLRGISLSEYGSEGLRVRLRRLSKYGSVAYWVERPARETQAEQYSDIVLLEGPSEPPLPWLLTARHTNGSTEAAGEKNNHAAAGGNAAQQAAYAGYGGYPPSAMGTAPAGYSPAQGYPPAMNYPGMGQAMLIQEDRDWAIGRLGGLDLLSRIPFWT